MFSAGRLYVDGAICSSYSTREKRECERRHGNYYLAQNEGLGWKEMAKNRQNGAGTDGGRDEHE